MKRHALLSFMMEPLLRKILALLCLSTLLIAQTRYALTNSNFTISQGSYNPTDTTRYLYNYNRLRLQSDYTNADYFATIIADGVNYLSQEFVHSDEYALLSQIDSNTPFTTKSNPYNYTQGTLYAKLYRAYGGFDNGTHRVSVGLQNITQGVGHIFNPTNLFNPRNTYAIEPDEVFGVSAIAYTYYSDNSWQSTLIASIDANNQGRYDANVKTTLYDIDTTLILFHSMQTTMAGFTFETNLGDSGVALRSENSYLKSDINTTTSTTKSSRLFQALLGADYAFESGLNATLELLYSSQTYTLSEQFLNINHEVLPNLMQSPLYIATSLSQAFTPYLEGALLYVESLNTYPSRFVAPTLSYSINDYNQITLGMQLLNGPTQSEFGQLSNSYFVNYTLAI